MNRSGYYLLLLLVLAGIIACDEADENIKPTYRYIQPEYELVGIEAVRDSLHFPLNDSTYNQIKSINIFEDADKEVISLFDQRSLSVSLFDVYSTRLIKRIELKDFLKIKTAENITVYVRSIDSFFVADKKNLYLLDPGTGITATIPFLTTSVTAVKTDFENGKPPVILGSKMWTGLKSSGTVKRTQDCEKWRSVYEFDLSSKRATLHYNLPEIYLVGYYGYQFLNSSYCYNNNNRFVFSFAADTAIYETDFDRYHASYLAKSSWQQRTLQPLQEGSGRDAGYKLYLTNNAYGNIYFDNSTNRYLRVAKRDISIADYETKKRDREQSIVILDDGFRIIGESLLDNKIDLSSLTITREGHIYSRVKSTDENAVHFVRLVYTDRSGNSNQLTFK